MSISITEYELFSEPDATEPVGYKINGVIDDVDFENESIVPHTLAETSGVWDESKALAILNDDYDNLLIRSENHVSHRISKLYDLALDEIDSDISAIDEVQSMNLDTITKLENAVKQLSLIVRRDLVRQRKIIRILYKILK